MSVTPPSTGVIVQAPVAGRVLPLAEVSDPVFAGGVLGQGVAVEPSGGVLVAPVSGTVVTAFPTGHAFGLKAHDGAEVLVHVGIDTVELEGAGFSRLVEQGAVVDAGATLGTVDLDAVRAAGYEATTIVVVLNSPDYASITTVATGDVAAGDALLVLAR
ncbi:MAG: PTS glucose transporter subunit IIA [Propionicimonas sp.]|uniref:PTS sugar transporter subunit IIA n=1 Tax=Propionicimonas sp. TaxID=1955623 RepID=UPI003D14BB1D